MAGITLPIHSNIIDWVLQNIQEDHLDTADLHQLDAWKTGEKQPTLRQLEDMSKKTHIPFGYFLLQTPPKEVFPLIEYRTVGSTKRKNPSRELIDVLDQMAAIQDWMRDELQADGMDKLPFVESFGLHTATIQIAQSIRHILELKTNWYSTGKTAGDNFNLFRERLTNCGVLVFTGGKVGSNTHRPLNINEFRAFTQVDPYAPLIFINTTDAPNGRLFSLLHETAHLWLGENSLFNHPDWSRENVSLLEQKCNAVAAELLVPIDDFRSTWDSSVPVEEMVERASHYFRCSEAVILRRAYDNGKIQRDLYMKLMAVQKQHWKNARANKEKSSGGDFYNTLLSNLDRRFLSALERSVVQGTTQDTDAYRLTGTNRKTYRAALARVEGV